MMEERIVTTTTTTTTILTALGMRRLAVVLLKMVTITSMIKIGLYPQYFILHRLSLR
jgi:hypothetical protein